MPEKEYVTDAEAHAARDQSSATPSSAVMGSSSDRSDAEIHDAIIRRFRATPFEDILASMEASFAEDAAQEAAEQALMDQPAAAADSAATGSASSRSDAEIHQAVMERAAAASVEDLWSELMTYGPNDSEASGSNQTAAADGSSATGSSS